MRPEPPAVEAGAVLRADGPARPLPVEGWLGVNGANLRAGRALWASPGHVAALAALRPASVRLPGGSTSQYWDLEAGRFVDDADVPADVARARADDQPDLDLADLARLTDGAGVGTTWVLNMTTSTPEEQVAALRAARAAGLAVERVELGNEMWTSEEPVVEAFPTPRDYAGAVPGWAAAVRAGLGADVQVAVSGYCDDEGSTRRKTSWDREVLPAVVAEVDAVACHPYFRTGLPRGRPVDDEADLAAGLRSGLERRESFAATVEEVVPEGLPVWATEWGLLERDARVLGTHAHALLVVDHGLGLLAQPRLERADLHALLGGRFAVLHGGRAVLAADQPGAVTDPGPTPVLGRSALGEGAALLWRALDGATSATPLSVDVDLTGADRRAADGLAHGVLLEGAPDGPRVLLVNPGDRPLRLTGPADLLADARRATSLTAGLGAVVRAGAGPAPVARALGDAGADGTLRLEARSVTLLEP